MRMHGSSLKGELMKERTQLMRFIAKLKKRLDFIVSITRLSITEKGIVISLIRGILNLSIIWVRSRLILGVGLMVRIRILI